MKRIFLALVVGVVALPVFAGEEPGTQDPSDAYRICVKSQTKLLAMAPASATEIAQAAIHRCLKEQIAYELSVFARNVDNPSGRDQVSQAVSSFDDVLTRMAISDVIEARMMKPGQN